MESTRIKKATIKDVIEALKKYPPDALFYSGYYPPGDDVSNNIYIEHYNSGGFDNVELSGDPD